MSVNIDEDTEFNDALRKHGIIPPRPPTPPTPPPPASPTFDDLLDDFTTNELDELGEDAADEEAERMIAAYRLQRIAEDKKSDKLAKFGRVYPIGREDYTREVTDASNVNEQGDEEESGTGVVCLLYKDGIPRSERTFAHIRTLAARYPRTKFVSIVGDKCIANLPDSRVPMLIVYKKGDIRNQIVAWGADRERRLEELEALFMVTGVLHIPERRKPGEKRGDDSSEDDDEDEEDYDKSSRMRSSATATNGRSTKNLRGTTKKSKDDDSDSDFDL